MSVYNLPPWLCMKQPYLFLSLLIPGPKGPGNNIDMYLQPLVEELKMLWNEGVHTYDAFKKEMFRLRAAMLWTINDFPAYAMLSSYSTNGFKACPVCVEDTESVRLKNCKKLRFMGARRWLCDDHCYRGWKNNFNGKVERRPCPNGMTGSQCLRATRGLIIKFGRRKKKKGTQKRKWNDQTPPEEDIGNWRKRSIFFKLPYWEHLLPLDGWSSNTGSCVRVEERKFVGLKSHDCHIIMQYLLSIAIRRPIKCKKLIKVLIELSGFFRQLCTKVSSKSYFEDLPIKIALTLCELECIMPLSFF